MQYHVDGSLVDAGEATVDVHDRGFLFGDAAVATLRAFGGSVFEWEAHADALARSCDRLGIDRPEDLRERCRETLSANDLSEALLRVTVTRGVDRGMDLDPGAGSDPSGSEPAGDGSASPTVVVAARPAPRGGLEGSPPYDGPAVLQTVKRRRPSGAALPADAETGSRLPGVLARRELYDADEALVRGPGGAVVGGADSNLFFVAEDGLHTPAEGPVYPGVVRDVVLELAREAEVPVHESAPDPSTVRDAEEAFLTSTAWGIRPVEAVDGLAVGDGPVTQLLDRQLRERIEETHY